METTLNAVLQSALKVIVALVILFISFKIINAVSKKLAKKLEKSGKIDTTIGTTISYAAAIALKILVVIGLVGFLGIQTSGITAVIGSLGVCAGLAVNGTLSNLAGGVMLLITRPIRVGDYILAQGLEGTVQEIHICYTRLLTLDNKTVYLPNSGLSTGTIVNCSREANRRVDLDFGVSEASALKAQELLLAAAKADKRVHADPAPFVHVTDYGDGKGVKMTVRLWCDGAVYWDLRTDFLEAAHKSFLENGVSVPTNPVEVTVRKAD